MNVSFHGMKESFKGMNEKRNRQFPSAGLAVLALCSAAVLFGCVGTSTPQTPQDSAQMEQFLQRLVGEWAYESEAMTAPDQPLQKGSGTETGRRVGGWVVLEGRIPTPGGTMTTLLTLGHDAQRGGPVATWVDSMSGMLWNYDGALDASGTTLTLSTQGPSSQDPGRLFHYRNILESSTPDRRELRSQILMDGEWITFLTARYSRVR